MSDLHVVILLGGLFARCEPPAWQTPERRGVASAFESDEDCSTPGSRQLLAQKAADGIELGARSCAGQSRTHEAMNHAFGFTVIVPRAFA